MDKTEKFWNRLSKKFDLRVTKYFGPSYARTIESAKKYLNAGDVVLDYACGTGLITIELADVVREIHGIDISSGMIDAARTKTAERNITNVNFARSTIFDDTLIKESYDALLAFNILHLVEDARKDLRRMHELLKPGGLVISTTSCMGEKKSLVNILVYLLMKTGLIPQMKFFTSAELENAITESDFRIIASEKFNEGGEPLPFIVAKKA